MKTTALTFALASLAFACAPGDALADEVIAIVNGRTASIAVPAQWTFTPTRDAETGVTTSFSLQDSARAVELQINFFPDPSKQFTSKAALEEFIKSSLKSLIIQMEFADGNEAPSAQAAAEKEKSLELTSFETGDGIGCYGTVSLPESKDHKNQADEYRLLTSGIRSFPADDVFLMFSLGSNSVDSPESAKALEFVRTAIRLEH